MLPSTFFPGPPLLTCSYWTGPRDSRSIWTCKPFRDWVAWCHRKHGYSRARLFEGSPDYVKILHFFLFVLFKFHDIQVQIIDDIKNMYSMIFKQEIKDVKLILYYYTKHTFRSTSTPGCCTKEVLNIIVLEFNDRTWLLNHALTDKVVHFRLRYS